MEVYSDRLELIGVDTMMSMTMPFLTRSDMQEVLRTPKPEQNVVAVNAG
jgi:hypothetical protein